MQQIFFSYKTYKLTPCKELNRKPNLFPFNDRTLLGLKAEDDTRCHTGRHTGKFFLGNSMRRVIQKSSGLRVHEHFLKGHILVMSVASLPQSKSKQHSRGGTWK